MSLYTRERLFELVSMAVKGDRSESSAQRPAFGNRLLDDPSRVFEHNAW